MENKKIIVVGGTGSWGRGLIQELLNRGVKQIKVYARNEFQMVRLLQEFQTPKVEAVIGDIRDRTALLAACKGCHILFHLAALKHVPICEKMPQEAIETNVIGTENVIYCASEAQMEKVVFASTDKAINANCAYGCTKLLGEKLILSANEQEGRTKYIVFRGGNLLGSAGSVIPLFNRQIEEQGAVTLTDDKMNRFFISVERASKLLVDAAVRGAGGEIFLPAMPSLLIKDVARYLLEKNGLDSHAIKVIGIRPGEKIDEELLSEHEAKDIYRLNDDLYLLCFDDRHSWAANKIMQKSRDYAYQSKQAILPYEQAREFLSAAGI